MSFEGGKDVSGKFFVALSELAGAILKARVEQHFAARIYEGASLSRSNLDITLFVGLANSLRIEVGGSAHISLRLDGHSD